MKFKVSFKPGYEIDSFHMFVYIIRNVHDDVIRKDRAILLRPAQPLVRMSGQKFQCIDRTLYSLDAHELVINVRGIAVEEQL